MTARVYVHVGPHKTGTTFLQAVLNRNKGALAADGVLYPGRHYSVQRQAIQELLGRAGRGGSAEMPRWDALVAEVSGWAGDVAIVSHEGLANAGLPVIRRVVESFSPAEVHLVYGARDLTKVLPGSWHTRMRNGHGETWQEFLAALRGESNWVPRVSPWRGPREVFGRWGRFVTDDHIHVITVPPSGAAKDVLWKRFTSVVGLDASKYSLEVPRLNESLGSAETEVLRRINRRMAEDMNRMEYMGWVQQFVIRRVLVKRPDQTRYALPVDHYDWVRPRSEATIDFLRQGQFAVTGALDDLVPRPPREAVRAPDDIDLDEALDAATDVAAALLRELMARQQKEADAKQSAPSSPRAAGSRNIPLRALRRAKRALASRSR